MYKNLKQKGLGGFSNVRYWSSSQYGGNVNNVWYHDFGNGKQYYALGVDKRNANSVRAVLAF
jgi:hypothetical protein